MGFPYHELIPAAVLLDNPGLTKEEFSRKLQATHYSLGVASRSASWDSYTESESFTPEELPIILGLSYSSAFTEFQKPRRDVNGIFLHPPTMRIVFQNTDKGLAAERYEVTTHVANALGEMEQKSISSRRNIRAGEAITFINAYLEDVDYLVSSVARKSIQGQRITPQLHTESFATFEDLYRVWPQFKPESMYDFSTTQGKFNFVFGGGNFIWKQVDGKFYLDQSTFDRIPAGFLVNEDLNLGYADLILTAEAIRQSAWKLLSYRGLFYLRDFLTAFPDSRARYERAVWDSHTSLFAKRKGMTNTEFLRMRLFPLSGVSVEEK
ncbi:MAG: hypothetical protein HY344_01205 [Candidatus Levybacteria bacterium]|nr:hypothetical protein [Candidatus Levybacteria bacterium]